MRARLIACLILALAAITFTQVWGADELTRLSTNDKEFINRKPVPRPAEIQGWVLLRVCSITGKLDHSYSEWAYIDPNFIVAIGNPPTSPDHCVAIHGANGKRIYVEGTLEGITKSISGSHSKWVE